jgi:hypothetical protein
MAARTDTKKIWPMPEIIKPYGDPYIITESPSRDVVCTDVYSRKMFVPTGNNDPDKMSRLHEMGHVAFTPEDLADLGANAGIDHDYMNVAEDMRISYFLNDRFRLVQSISDELLENGVERMKLKDDFKGATLMSVATLFTPEGYLIRSLLPREWQVKINVIREVCESIMIREYWESDGTLQVAKYLQDLFSGEKIDVQDANEEELTALDPQYYNDVQWGTMEIVTPPLHLSLMQRRLIRRITPKEHGTGIMFPTRLDHDDKMFGHMKRVAGGTVLIDVSSSMDLSNDEIKAMIKAAPGLTVAIYAGYSSGRGELIIVAKKGKMADIKNINHGGCNVIDGPALRWLATMPEPRVWVCDGLVTGVGDEQSVALTTEAKRIRLENNIRQAFDTEGAVRALKK